MRRGARGARELALAALLNLIPSKSAQVSARNQRAGFVAHIMMTIITTPLRSVIVMRA